MRKLIRFAAAAFLVWAVTTFAWAALSHVTGATGPATASGATLDFVAGAITWADPPGVLGAPQRFAARQIRQAADAVERLHRGPERLAAQVVDELGHRHRHGRGGRHFVVRVNRTDAPSVVRIPLDELDQARSHARARAVVELERHRSQLDQQRSRLDRARAELDRARGQAERARARAEFERTVEERVRSGIARVEERMQEVEANERADSDLKRDMLRKLREILRDLDKELNEVRVDVTAELESADLEALQELEVDGLSFDVEQIEKGVEGPVRIRIRNR